MFLSPLYHHHHFVTTTLSRLVETGLEDNLRQATFGRQALRVAGLLKGEVEEKAIRWKWLAGGQRKAVRLQVGGESLKVEVHHLLFTAIFFSHIQRSSTIRRPALVVGKAARYLDDQQLSAWFQNSICLSDYVLQVGGHQRQRVDGGVDGGRVEGKASHVGGDDRGIRAFRRGVEVVGVHFDVRKVGQKSLGDASPRAAADVGDDEISRLVLFPFLKALLKERGKAKRFRNRILNQNKP